GVAPQLTGDGAGVDAVASKERVFVALPVEGVMLIGRQWHGPAIRRFPPHAMLASPQKMMGVTRRQAAGYETWQLPHQIQMIARHARPLPSDGLGQVLGDAGLHSAAVDSAAARAFSRALTASRSFSGRASILSLWEASSSASAIVSLALAMLF